MTAVDTPPEQAPEKIEQAAQQPKKKIAILGSAVSSVGLAPFKDPDWEIWGCSPANRDLPRCDVWFELHNVEIKDREGLTEWMDWLKTKPKVYMQQPLPVLMINLKNCLKKFHRMVVWM